MSALDSGIARGAGAISVAATSYKSVQTEEEMNPDLTAQMREFGASLQAAMAEYIQRTMKRQAAMDAAVQRPVEDRIGSIAAGVQRIFTEQMDLFVRALTGLRPGAGASPEAMKNPALDCGTDPDPMDDFSARVQRIMREQMQIFAATVVNPTPEELAEFLATMRGTMADQMRLAADLQDVIGKQMGRFMENLCIDPIEAAERFCQGLDVKG